ncbi:MAG: branched-chain amino acid transport system ATP-binding protein [Chloroflexota bacterium]|nr:branched-chain amino acid transport system ATP-binding protein [Chloroflexota bacterium]
MLEVNNLTVAYGGIVALDQVSFSVPDGSITTVLGANGAGKTTLVRTISGLVKARHGSVLLGEQQLLGRSPEAIARLGVGHVPEGHGIISELTVDENLRLGGLWRRERNDQRVAIEEAYELFPPLLTRRGLQASNLSGGERQMLSIGRALVARPTALLLDEPSLGLAGGLLALIMQRLQTLVTTRGLTVLLIEQNARSALSVADQAVVLSLGKVALTDSAERLAGDDALRHAYLGF